MACQCCLCFHRIFFFGKNLSGRCPPGSSLFPHARICDIMGNTGHTRHCRHVGKIIAQHSGGILWQSDPHFLFVREKLSVNYVRKSFSADEINAFSAYHYFTDIEFNPAKSINTQARVAAIVRLILVEYGCLLDFHKMILFNITENMSLIKHCKSGRQLHNWSAGRKGIT